MKLFITCLILTMNIFADENKRSFPDFKSSGKNYIFVDFKTANHILTIDFKTKTILLNSNISFVAKEKGFPLFDFLPSINETFINGEETSAILVQSPDKETQFKSITNEMKKGLNDLKIKAISHNFPIVNKKDFFFQLNDLEDRSFLEKYFPSNLEFDSYQMNIKIIIKNNNTNYKVYTNGDLKTLNHNIFQIHFPTFFNSAFPFIHLAPLDFFIEKKIKYRSIDKRDISVFIYSQEKSEIDKIQNEIHSLMRFYEKKISPWPQRSLMIYADSKAKGMEYYGAIHTKALDLKHELAHIYFGRNIKPANGISGWIDEAIATWFEYNSPKSSQLCATKKLTYPKIKKLSPYRRYTNDAAYNGYQLFSYLSHKFDHRRKVDYFLKNLFKKYQLKTIDTHQLKQELELFYKIDFNPLFEKCVY